MPAVSRPSGLENPRTDLGSRVDNQSCFGGASSMKMILTVWTVALFGMTCNAAEGAIADLPRSRPEAQGLSAAAILAFVDEADTKIDALHSFMLLRHGQVVA